MTSRKTASLAGLALGLPGDPVFAEEPQPLELDAISVTADYESPTGPVKGYRAVVQLATRPGYQPSGGK